MHNTSQCRCSHSCPLIQITESMRGKLNRLAAVLKGDSMSSTVYWGAVGELEKMQKELTDSGTEVKSLIATFKKKRRDILEASGHNEFSSDEE